jgi:trans-2,3-dihydro-3-hydroxyanthranilate isomerase
VPFVMIPVHDVERCRRPWSSIRQLWEQITPDRRRAAGAAYHLLPRWRQSCRPLPYPHVCSGHGHRRGPGDGLCVAAFSGAIHSFDQLIDGHHPFLIEQGVEMGRPSLLHLHIDVSGGEISNGPDRWAGGEDCGR